MVPYHIAEAAGHKVFYREAGDRSAPAVLLLLGVPTSSHMFRNLIPRLAEHYRVVAPDLPGFGFSLAPEHGPFRHTFDDLVCRLLLEKKNRRQSLGSEFWTHPVHARLDARRHHRNGNRGRRSNLRPTDLDVLAGSDFR